MPDAGALAAAAATLAALAVFAWTLGSILRNSGIVDSFWGLFFLCGVLAFAASNPAGGPRTALLIALVATWSLRLSLYITVRNHGQPEDRRYRAIRARNQPGYFWKSLFIVFGLQALIAFVLATPLFVAMASTAPLNAIDATGVAMWACGFFFEAIGDLQLARFRREPANAGKVFDQGLWRYTRHPNYFGEALLWWGFGVIAIAAGAWWTCFAPAMMTLLLLKVSGVALLEHDIHERRPEYRDYVRRTSRFLPRPPS